MQQMWIVFHNYGPNHLGLWHRLGLLQKEFASSSRDEAVAELVWQSTQ